ncbi:Retrovirus-related Pol polyprotein from transposon TNT 1-94 [Vitis vinifera]|uniref:Retrovirus-related Pol polyprotein from transposon TNT 1-94 n=1 Tax=Vitis vinifera TaxID=29760 RepID=A0A438EZ06_VITVI|nr:Retrovirus-related Pol polyprotein from transposon TNT 1-94 [Vitis vinifera]
MPTDGERYVYVGNGNKAAMKSLDGFKNFKAEFENQLSKKIKVVRSDHGGEYYGRYDGSGEQRPRPFAKYLMECGIVSQYTMSGTSSQNGVIERSFFEMSNAKFVENVELSGREPLRKVVFEEESVCIPIIALDMTQRDSKGNIARYKAYLVTKGFIQKEDIDYKETFSAVSSNDSFSIIMALVSHYDLKLHQRDVKTAFLNGNIDETIYMVQPENFDSNDSKQLENTVDQCIYLKFSGSKFIILVLYVDDILLASIDVELLHETKRFLSSKSDMKDLGNASFVLGIQIYRDHSRGILGLSQNSYIDKVLSRFGMSNYAPGDTPMAKGDKFSLYQCPRNELERKDMERFSYALAIGSLMYAQVCTRSDIAYIVGTLGRYLSNPGSSHLEIVGYSDSDFAGCLDSRKSTSSYIFMLARGAISWKSVKETLIASSTMETEFMACYEASNHGIWLRNFITKLRNFYRIENPLGINCDNETVEFYSKNNRSSSKSKHIDIKFLVVKEKVQSLQVSIEHISTNYMIADPLTKDFPPKVYHEYDTHMGVVHINDVSV